MNELLRRNEPEPQYNTLWFPTHEYPGKIEDHTPIQTRVLTEIMDLKEKEQLNSQADIECRTIFLST